MREKRNFSSEIELKRAEEVENQGIVEGYFIKYNSPAEYGRDGFFEQIDPNALTETLARNSDIKCFYNHNYDLILGRTSNNTLTLTNDEVGLYGSCKLNLNDSQARDVFERVKRGDITGCSFGAWIEDEDFNSNNNTFTVKKVDLIEVSVCPMPFYDSTTMEARDKLVAEKKEIQRKRKILEEKYGSKNTSSK